MSHVSPEERANIDHALAVLKSQVALLERGEVPLGLVIFVAKSTIETTAGKVAVDTSEVAMVAAGEHQQAVCEALRRMTQRVANVMDLEVGKLATARKGARRLQ